MSGLDLGLGFAQDQDLSSLVTLTGSATSSL